MVFREMSKKAKGVTQEKGSFREVDVAKMAKSADENGQKE